MNGKETKVPIYIVIVVAFILIAAGGYYFIGGKPGEKLTGEVKTTPVPTARESPAATASAAVKEAPAGEATAVSTAPASAPAAPAASKVETVKCELCHKDPQELKPHVNGGKLCINCHGSQVHNIHIGAGTVNLDCATCHGSPPKIPVVEKGEGPGHYTVCEKCHGPPPDSLKPSLGNLVVIHLSRSKYCTNCHGVDIGTIHAAKLANASKK